MAKATRTNVEKKVQRTELVPSITLTLSIEEAEALAVLTSNIAGPFGSPRTHTDNVYYALTDARVSVSGKPVAKQLSGSMTWLKEPKKSPYGGSSLSF